MKRLLLLFIVAALLSGGTAMGQNKKGRTSKNRNARTEQRVKKSTTETEKKPDTSLSSLLENDDVQLTKEEYVDELKVKHTVWRDADGNIVREYEDNVRVLKEETVLEMKMPEDHKNPTGDQVFKSVEQMPQFPGGDAALMKYLNTHIQYPPMAAEENIQGKVILQFIVEKDGSVGEVKVVRSVRKDLDKEAIRVAKSLQFTPGRQNGQPVRVWYTLPFTFKLQGKN